MSIRSPSRAEEPSRAEGQSAPDRQSSPDRWYSIATQADTAKQVLSTVLAKLKEDDWSEHELFSVHLAVEEALINAIRHGNKMDPTKTVQVCYRLSRAAVRIEITDEGDGFDPDGVPDCTFAENLERPSGRGILLMRRFMTHVEFNDRGNRVVMEKHREDRPPQ